MSCYELSHVFEAGMPHHPAIPPLLHVFQRRLGEVVRPGGVSIASDLLIAPLHSGTHIDAPSHVADQHELDAPRDSGEHFPPLLTKALVLDVRAAVAAGCHELGPAELAAALAGTTPEPGSVVLLATGWGELWSDADAYAGSRADPPGISVAAAEQLADAGVIAIGADTPTVEAASSQYAVHREMLSRRGVYLIENLNLGELCDDGHREAIFLALPLRIAGATASPLRCVALTGEGMSAVLSFLKTQAPITVGRRGETPVRERNNR